MKNSNAKDYSILNNINSPTDLKSLPEEKIVPLCGEIRRFLVDNVRRTGGHLASNLGIVELSVAIHRVFDSPNDHIIFDVGHQSYVHKMLTGRRDGFSELRKSGGLSGFPKISESEHDAFGTGHSSTSVSAALGFAIADKQNGSNARTVAVIGDGAFTGGMVHEALNNCKRNIRLTIILNENEMSISKNTGRFAKSIARLRAKKFYIKTKARTRDVLKNIPVVGDSLFETAKSLKKTVKDVLYGSNYFEDMGIYYLGPVDGNDYEAMESILRDASELDECCVIHVKTKKGKGYKPAEVEPWSYHGIQPNGKTIPDTTFSHEFGKKLSELADSDEKICAITAAMSEGTGLEAFRKEHADKLFDVGIAEPHAVTFAAGLAANGHKPVVAIYSTFLQRAYDNIIHVVALQSLPVTFCIDRAGLNASDGATHHGIFDVAFLSQIPNVSIYTPATFEGMKTALENSLSDGKCNAIRYPSGTESELIRSVFYPDGNYTYSGIRTVDIDDSDGIVITHGKIAEEAIHAKKLLSEKGFTLGIILCEKIKPYSELAEKISAILPEKAMKLVTLEEEIRAGGFGMMLLDALSDLTVMKNKSTRILATTDTFCIPEKGQTCYEASGVDRVSIVKAFEG